MTPRPETWVLCDAAHPMAPANAIRITLGGKRQSMTVNIDGIVDTLSGRLTPRFHDLIRIAAIVLAADGAVRRGRNEDDDVGEKWCRRFRFVIGVDEPEFWNQPEVTDALEATLGFLSQDTFALEFRPRDQKQPRQLVFSGPQGKPVVPWDDVRDVALFSGGLDSFAGAADLILGQKRTVVLVSHLSATKMAAVQNALFIDLARIAKEHGCPEPRHVVVDLQRHDKRLRSERTQRTRSLLYAAIAGAVANLIGRDRVCAFENGIVAMNLPIAGSVVGARATRTAHPRALVSFGKVLSAVAGRQLRAENPFALKTRADVIHGLASSPALHLAKQTVSCAHIHRKSTMHPHCGVCSQCIDRQFGFLGAGMQEHDSELGYAVRLTRDPWKKPATRDLVLHWISAAHASAECKTADRFLGSHGEAARAVPFLMESCDLDADAANHAVFELHRRHGEAVGRAVEGVKASAKNARRLAANTLPALLLPPRPQKGKSTTTEPGHVPFGIENRFLFIKGEWRITFRNGPAVAVPDAKGLRYLSMLLRAPGEVHTATQMVDRAEGREPPRQVVLDERGTRAVQAHIEAIKVERNEAEEMDDTQGASTRQAEIDVLTDLLTRKGVPTAGTAAIAAALESEIRLAITAIGKVNKPLGDHLQEQLQVGAVLWYRASGMVWDTTSLPARVASNADGRPSWPPPELESVVWDDLTDLEREQVRVFFKAGAGATLEVPRVATRARGVERPTRHDYDAAKNLERRGVLTKAGRTGRRLVAIPRGMPCP